MHEDTNEENPVSKTTLGEEGLIIWIPRREVDWKVYGKSGRIC
jgi:hypothetical protein